MVATRTIVVLDPGAEELPEEQAAAPRLPSLRGAVVGLVDNSKSNADVFLQELGEALKEQYGIAELVYTRKASSGTPIDPEVLERLVTDCQAVVHGVAD